MKLMPRPDQEAKIQKVLDDTSGGALIADTMGKGKTVMGTEILLRAGWTRTLIVGIRDTGPQWAKTIAGQPDGTVELKLMNSTVEGRGVVAARYRCIRKNAGSYGRRRSPSICNISN